MLKSIFFALASIFVLGLILQSPPAGESVSTYQLAKAAELAAKYPEEAKPFREKINNMTLKNGEFELLKQAVKPAKERDAKAEEAASLAQLKDDAPLLAWLYENPWVFYTLASLGIGCGVVVQIHQMVRAEPGERYFFGINIG
jgi:uncharacterized protein (DUF4415 family)